MKKLPLILVAAFVTLLLGITFFAEVRAGELGDQLRALAAKVDAEEAETCPAPIVCPAPVVCPICPVAPPAVASPALSLLSNDAIPTTTLAKPLRGGSYIEPTYKTVVTRAGAPADSGGTWTRHIYSRQQVYNADGTRYLLQGSNGTLVVYDAATWKPLRTLTGLSGSMEPLWHPANPALLLHTGKSGAGGVFSWHNVATGAETVAFSLAGKAPFPAATHYRTRGEGTLTADGRYLALMAEIGESFVGLLTVETTTGRIVGYLPAGTLGRPDHVSITHSGRWVVPSWSSSTGATAGTRAYSLDFKVVRQLHSDSTHSDLAIGPEGDDYYVYADYSAASGGYVRARNIDTGVAFPLLDLYPASDESTAIHISGQASKRPGWVTFSTHGDRGGKYSIYKKVMVAELKPGGRVFNAGHILNTATGYWAEPHASPNRDLTRITFVGNLGSGQFRQLQHRGGVEVSQRAFLAELDTDLHAAFADAGMADIGQYTAPDAAPGAVPIDVRVYVDRNVQALGEFGQVTGNRTEVGFVREDVAPVKGARLVVDGDTFITVEPVAGRDDGSLSYWVVRRG